MTNPDYFIMLKSLVDDYESHSLGYDEYREKRKKILEHLDQYYNSTAIVEETDQESGLLDKVGGFLKGLRQN